MHRKIKQGMFLIASLLLTSVLTATGVVLIKITASGKQISDNSIQKTQLLTATTMSNSIISASIDNIMKANSTANIFLVDTSTGSRTIVKNPDPTITTINLCSLIFNKSTCDTLGTGPTNPTTLVPAAQQLGNFSISQSGPTITTPAPNAYYNVVVQSLICGSGSSMGCQKSDLRITKKRSCPSSTNVPPKPMSAVAMLDTDVIPAGYNNKFPNLFCTCDPPFATTKADGSCVKSCAPGQGLGTGGACQACTGNTYSAGGEASTCAPCTLSTGTLSCDATNGNAATCKAGYGLPGCAGCSPGSYSLGGTSSCNSCTSSTVTGCNSSTGDATSCTSGYSLSETSGASGTTCISCTSSTVTGCSSTTGGATSCSSGYSLSGASGASGTTCISCTSATVTACNSATGGATACTTNYSLSGTSGASGTTCHACTSSTVTACNSTTGGATSCTTNYSLSGASGASGTTCNSCTSSTVTGCSSSTGGSTSCATGYMLNGASGASGTTCIISCGANASTSGGGQNAGNGCNCNNTSYYSIGNGQCSPCPNGAATNGNGTVINGGGCRCTPSYYTVNNQCSLCPVGGTTDGDGAPTSVSACKCPRNSDWRGYNSGWNGYTCFCSDGWGYYTYNPLDPYSSEIGTVPAVCIGDGA